MKNTEEDYMEELSTNPSVADSRLTTFLQKYISQNHPRNSKLKKFRLCGSKHIPTIAPAVFIVTNGERSRIHGIARCHSSWGCPTCTPKRMAEYGGRIACAIDALKIQYKMQATMLTLTMPHLKFMTCKDTFTILQNSWRIFSKAMYKRTAKYQLKATVGTDKRAVGQKGETKTYTKINRAPFPNMKHKLGITHNIRVYEFTWGESHGWHPHIHLLLWLPTKNFSKLNDGWEEKIADSWWEICKAETLKYFKAKYPDRSEANKSVTDALFTDWRKNPKSGHKVAYFSKNKNGTISKVSSSHYISGWGGDCELTGQRKEKHAKSGHYSPAQLLQAAYENPKSREFFMKLYIEFLETTFGKRRIMFSPKTGLNKIIEDWQQTNQWFEVLKKKVMAKATTPWKVAQWFKSEQWYQISFYHLTPNLIELSLLPDAREKIAEFLLTYNIKISTKPHPDEKYINDCIFENSIPKGTKEQATIAIANQKRSVRHQKRICETA